VNPGTCNLIIIIIISSSSSSRSGCGDSLHLLSHLHQHPDAASPGTCNLDEGGWAGLTSRWKFHTCTALLHFCLAPTPRPPLRHTHYTTTSWTTTCFISFSFSLHKTKKTPATVTQLPHITRAVSSERKGRVCDHHEFWYQPGTYSQLRITLCRSMMMHVGSIAAPPKHAHSPRVEEEEEGGHLIRYQIMMNTATQKPTKYPITCVLLFAPVIFANRDIEPPNNPPVNPMSSSCRQRHQHQHQPV
jgi:hypothetical protein